MSAGHGRRWLPYNPFNATHLLQRQRFRGESRGRVVNLHKSPAGGNTGTKAGHLAAPQSQSLRTAHRAHTHTSTLVFSSECVHSLLLFFVSSGRCRTSGCSSLLLSIAAASCCCSLSLSLSSLTHTGGASLLGCLPEAEQEPEAEHSTSLRQSSSL